MLNGFSSFDDILSKLSTENTTHLSELQTLYGKKAFRCVVIVIIDALRVDFTKSKHMPFLQNRLRLDGSVEFIAKVQPPTVTLPRIKALTTGSIPGFVDVILNFGSSSLMDDNIITQMKIHGKKMAFYGDDTWLDLFPTHFIRSDGTTSFFVTDYTEVDNNVTRHLDKELEMVDFDLMVLHYLGLDHIGHLAGPQSPLVGPKLEEMDDIIKKLYEELSKLSDPSLIVVCGDHGMSDQGGHGGATDSETRVPVIFLKTEKTSLAKNKKENEAVPVIDQIDLAPTLSVLLGVPIPKNNLGTVIVSVLSDHSLLQKLMVLLANGIQVSEVLKHNLQDYDIDKGYQLYIRTHKSLLTWLKGNYSTSVGNQQGMVLLKQFEDSIKLMSSTLSTSVTQYDVYGLFLSIIFLWMILFTICLTYNQKTASYFSWQMCTVFLLIGIFAHTTVCTSDLLHSDLLCDFSISIQLVMLGTFAVFSSIICLCIFKEFRTVFSLKPFQFTGRTGNVSKLLISGTFLHTISLLSSSFVEEEHQTWYFFITTIHLLILKDLVDQIVNPWIPYKLAHTNKQDINEFEVIRNSPQKDFKVQNVIVESDYREIDNDNLKKELQLLCKDNVSKKTDKNLQYKIPAWSSVTMVTVVLVICRVMRSWNQTGNKWLNVPDVGDWLIRPENIDFLSVIVAVSLIMVFLLKRVDMTGLQQILYSVGLVSVYLQKSSNGSLVYVQIGTEKSGVVEAQVVYIVGLLYTFTSIPVKESSNNTMYRLFLNLHTSFTLVILVLARPHNIILVNMMVMLDILVEKHIWSNIQLQTGDLVLYYLWMGQAAFFYQGNSNSISTVDVSAGYIGLHGYQPVLVGILLTVSTYGGPIFWMLSMIKYVFWMSAQITPNPSVSRKRLSLIVHTVMLTRALPLAVYTVLVTYMRYHLFVWTVFSPKLLYEGLLTVVLSVICLILLICNLFL